MNLNFTSEKIKDEALSVANANYETSITSEDAFMIVLNGLDYETIDNLCVLVAQKLSINSPLEVYNLIQNNSDIIPKDILLQSAYEIIHSKGNLGNKIVDGKFNASSWIAHSLYEGELASVFASLIGLNPDTARKLGILHDIGRKFDNTFMHTVKGYEYLSSLGLKNEAVSCISHSFLSVQGKDSKKGNRCANCDPALEGFYINNNGEGVFDNDSQKDDVAHFLDCYHYNIYDVILNVSDLMAMSSGITSPYERLKDIYSRRDPDSRNSSFFKICFINTLNEIMSYITKNTNYLVKYNINDFQNKEDIDKLLINTSNKFMEVYMGIIYEYDNNQSNKMEM